VIWRNLVSLLAKATTFATRTVRRITFCENVSKREQRRLSGNLKWHQTAPRIRKRGEAVAGTPEAMMDDLKKRHEKLLADADDCDLVAKNSEGPAARETFRRIAVKLREDAAGVAVVMKIRSKQAAEQ